jgi:hypothetical protein
VEDGELMVQDEDLKILGGVTAGELGEELYGAAQRQVGESWQHRGGLRGGAAEHHGSKPRSMRTPAHGPCLNICTLRGAGANLTANQLAGSNQDIPVSLARLANLTRAGSGVFWITVRGGQIIQVAEQWSP